MKILIVAAMPNEIKAIKEWIKSAKLKTNLDIDYLCCGMGNYETISALERYFLQHSEPIFVFNVWICWYRNPNNEKKVNPVQIASIVNIYTEKEVIIPPFLQIAPMKNWFCSESIVLKKPLFQKKINIVDGEMYFDMESRWIEFIASKYKLPRLILKVPFDFIWEEKKVEEKCYKGLSGALFKTLKDLPYRKYLEKILEWIDWQQKS